jgi:hypothetical protein
LGRFTAAKPQANFSVAGWCADWQTEIYAVSELRLQHTRQMHSAGAYIVRPDFEARDIDTHRIAIHGLAGQPGNQNRQ